jgi:O-antigen/teichoic acid export membrane protein
LGLYGHATVYGAFLYGSAGAVQRAARATALSEARARVHDMPVAAFATRLQQYALSFAALAMALLGDEAIDLLSNGKFGEAYILAAILILAVFVQTSLFVHDSLALTRYTAQASAKIATAAGVVGFVAMIPLVLAYGALGAVLAALVQALFHRFRLVRLIEGHIRPQAHTKQLSIVAGVLGILWARSLWSVEIEIRLLCLMGLVVLWLCFSGANRLMAAVLGGILARRRRGN